MPKIFKAATVYVDRDHKVQIIADVKREVPEVSQEPGAPPEVQTVNVVEQARREAKEILAKAKGEAEVLVSKAQQEVETLQSDAQFRMEEESRRVKDESYAQGYQEGISKAEAEGEAIRTQAQEILEATYQECDELRRAVEPQAVELIINIVGKLLGDAVILKPGLVTALIRQGFSESTPSGNVTVRVSEFDYPQVMAQKEALLADLSGSVELDILKDASLGPADCVIETLFGEIDCSLGVQFEALRENLVFLANAAEPVLEAV